MLKALHSIRAPQVTGEYDIHQLVGIALTSADINYVHEAPLEKGNRIDFLVSDVGIEVKKSKPNRAMLLKQIERYLVSDKLNALVVVLEKNIDLPAFVNQKRVEVVNLQKLWGIANDVSTNYDFVDMQDDDENIIPYGAIQYETEIGEDEENTSAQASFDIDDYFSAQNLAQISLPSYLEYPDFNAPNTYGTLSYNRKQKCWTIKAEPSVTELCKRLFPQTGVKRRGEARFSSNRRNMVDLCWLMQRYPLTLAQRDQKQFDLLLFDAQNSYKRKELLLKKPLHITPPQLSFVGTLKDFQKEGLSFLLSQDRALLADEMGLGKTVQALSCLATMNKYPILLVVPPHLVKNWESEIQRFLLVENREPMVEVIKGLKPYALGNADIYIVHYLLLRGWKEALRKYDFPIVIFDEIQELRHSGTEKYSSASLLSSDAERVYGLSGTPIYNNGGEIWNVMNIIDFHFLGDFESFSREWCAGYGNNIVLKPQILGDFLRREGVMLRRTKQQVLKELPEKRRLVQEIDADGAKYTLLMQNVLKKIKKLKEDEMTSSERALLEDQISLEERQATGIAKAPYVCKFVQMLIEAGEKVLLFAHHHAVMDIYKKELSSCHPVFITGRETAEQKNQNVIRFMEDKTALACISLRSASGLNLQKATCVVFGELDWSPAVHSQAEDRAHRIGKTDSLLCYYLVSKSGSDSDIQEALGLKVSQFLSLMGDKPQDEQEIKLSASIAKKHVEKIIQKYNL